MKRQNFNDKWTMLKPGENPLMAAFAQSSGAVTFITLPHDAMIHEDRTQKTRNQHQTGFYPGGCYTYLKTFEVSLESN